MKLTRRQFMKLGLGATALTGIGGLKLVALAETDELDIHHLELTLPNLPAAFDGYTMVQISDIHMGSGMTEARLMEIVDIMNTLEPDMMALTGDFVTRGEVDDVAEALIRPMSQLSARDGSFAVLGNHDHHANAEKVQALLQESDVLDVSNDVFTLERDGQFLHIAGVDDAWYHHDRLDIVLDKLPGEGGAILLMHEPDFADTSGPTGRFDLQISGHSHGGQVILPVSGPVVLPRLGTKYPIGQYQVGSMIQYTNRGVGTVGPPVRINCPPEITVFTLRTL